MIPIASDSVYLSIVSSQRNVESNHGVAGLDQVQVFLWDIGLAGGSVEEELNLFQESGFLEVIKFGSVAGWVEWVAFAGCS